jgi:hypothetical protein
MKKLYLIAALAILVSVSACKPRQPRHVHIGMPYNEVIQVWGNPDRVISNPGNTTLIFRDYLGRMMGYRFHYITIGKTDAKVIDFSIE